MLARTGASCALALLITQTTFAADTQDAAATAQSSTASPAVQPGTVDSEGSLSRWLDLDAFSFSYRWRDEANTYGTHLYDTGQERQLIEGRFKLDQEGKYSINFRASSGNYFTWAYADNIGYGYNEEIPFTHKLYTPLQAKLYNNGLKYDLIDKTSNNQHNDGWALYFRQLYFSAAPIKQVAVEYGSLGFNRGAGTEITSYDEDGYLDGERLRLRDPQHIFFDEVSVTYGYVGNYSTPNFFARGDQLLQSNYHQFLLEKKLSHHLKASTDYTFQNKTDTVREALLVYTHESHVLDSARVELYQRVDSVPAQGIIIPTGNGWAFTGAKTFNKKFQLEGGYASIDQHYDALEDSRFKDAVGSVINGDNYGIGDRFFTRANYKYNPYVSLFGFYTHEVGSTFYTANKQGMTFGASIDFKSLLNEKLHLGIGSVKQDN